MTDPIYEGTGEADDQGARPAGGQGVPAQGVTGLGAKRDARSTSPDPVPGHVKVPVARRGKFPLVVPLSSPRLGSVGRSGCGP